MRRGFSLLEVILALAILSGAVIVLGEVARMGLEHSRWARDLAEAQLLCESKLNEVVAGIELPEPIEGAMLAESSQRGPAWLYSLEVETLDETGLLAVRVTVMQDIPPEKRPVRCSLVRWIMDPELEAAADEETQ